MLQTRVIPVLLLKDSGVYKGIKFKKHMYVGDPINTVRLFNEKEVDELIIFDIEASKMNKSIQFDLLKSMASEAFMPIAYGGGIKTVEDAQKLFSLGIEKVILNTYALREKTLIQKLVKNYGSQSVVVSLDIKKDFFGQYRVYIMSGTQKISNSPIQIATMMQDLGIGELVINSISHDGMMQGYDLNLIKTITKDLSIPVIVCGGAGNLADFVKAKESGAHACAAGSMFVYHGVHRAVLISYPKYDQLYNLFKGNASAI